jgi:hypothetical protein
MMQSRFLSVFLLAAFTLTAAPDTVAPQGLGNLRRRA